MRGLAGAARSRRWKALAWAVVAVSTSTNGSPSLRFVKHTPWDAITRARASSPGHKAQWILPAPTAAPAVLGSTASPPWNVACAGSLWQWARRSTLRVSGGNASLQPLLSLSGRGTLAGPGPRLGRFYAGWGQRRVCSSARCRRLAWLTHSLHHAAAVDWRIPALHPTLQLAATYSLTSQQLEPCSQS